MPIISGGQIMPHDGTRQAFEKGTDLVANDFAGLCRIGSTAIGAAGRLYVCTATNGTTTSTWVLVGTQA